MGFRRRDVVAKERETTCRVEVSVLGANKRQFRDKIKMEERILRFCTKPRLRRIRQTRTKED